jgi:recombinational DNA repair protein RecR
MPLLSSEQIHDLLTLAHMHRACGDCGQHTAMDYCRTCDEFYWVHRPGCVLYEQIHHGHRLTLVPFVEER